MNHDGFACLFVCSFLSSDAAGTKDIQKSLFKGARVSLTYCRVLLLEEQGPDLKE